MVAETVTWNKKECTNRNAKRCNYGFSKTGYRTDQDEEILQDL